MKPALMTVEVITIPEIRPSAADIVDFCTFVTERMLDSESLSNARGLLLHATASPGTIRQDRTSAAQNLRRTASNGVN